LSNISDAPYLGEAATIFAFTRRPLAPVQGDQRARPPAIVYASLAGLTLLGAGEGLVSLLKLRRWRRGGERRYTPLPQYQVLAWAVLLAGAVVAWLTYSTVVGVVILLAALTLPLQRRKSGRTRVEAVPAS
jgi:hypothetical protein